MAVFKKGSIDGVKYLFVAHETGFGRKAVSHEIINAKRFVEDMGPDAGDFTIHAIITGKTDSEYNQAKKRLDDVLKKSGTKSLIHPSYGSKQVFFTKCRVSENISEARKAIYTLVCLETDADIYPTSSSNNKSFINQKFDEAMQSLQDRFPDLIEGVDTFVAGYNDFRENAADLIESIQQGTEFINGLGDETSAFVTDALDLQNSLTSLIQAPSQLAARLRNVYDNLTLIVTDPKDLITVAQNLSGTTDEEVVPGSGVQSDIMNNAREALQFFNDVALMSIACQAATVINYITDEELASIKALLGALLDGISPDVDDDAYYALLNLKTATIEYLDTLSPQLPKILTVRVNQIPASVLSYKLYGTTERMDEIINLNNVANPAYVSGYIKVLSR